MKKYILSALAIMTAISFLPSCVITEDCSREDLKTYADWGNGQSYVSVCKFGKWMDSPMDPKSDNIQKIFAKFPDCNVVGCYSNDDQDCECLEDSFDPTYVPDL